MKSSGRYVNTLGNLVEVAMDSAKAAEKARKGKSRCIDCAKCVNPDLAKREHHMIVRYPQNMRTSNQRNYKGGSKTVETSFNDGTTTRV